MKITSASYAANVLPASVRLITVCFFLLINQQLIHAQDKGIHFEKSSSWKEVLAKAKAENKYIFIDCFTTWCGPCKYMSSNIFPLEEVGTFFNKNFINTKFQIDTTAKDPEAIKSQYADAAFISKKYKINAYPTYLFFNPNGELVHRELGSSSASEFITKATNALDPAKQYFTQIKKYEAGNRDAALLKNLAILALHANDMPNSSKYAKEFLATKPNLQSKENLQFVFETTTNTSDKGFNLMINNIAKYETVIDKNQLHNSLARMILQEQYSKHGVELGHWDAKQWQTYSASFTKQYPSFAEEILLQLKTSAFRFSNDWASYAATVEQYTKSPNISISMLNEFAWAVFGHCDDKKILESVLRWSKLTFENEAKIEPGYIDTYANLLYKLGRKDEALTWEKKAQAIAIEQGSDKSWGQDVIDKINKNEPTW
jgi:thiol-disulfide isomerase/thioredoxin